MKQDGYKVISEYIVNEQRVDAETRSQQGLVNICLQQHNGQKNEIEKTGKWERSVIYIKYNPPGEGFFIIPVYTFSSSKTNMITRKKVFLLITVVKGRGIKPFNIMSKFNQETNNFGPAKVQ